MSIGRIKRGRIAADVLGEHFTQIYNQALRDRRLSRRARGLLAELLTHQDGYGVSVAALVAAGPEGREAIRKALTELEQHGYLTREQIQDPETKQWKQMVYTVTDMPDGLVIQETRSSQPSPRNPTTGETADGGRCPETRTTGNRATGNRGTENRPHKKTTSIEDQQKKINLSPVGAGTPAPAARVEPVDVEEREDEASPKTTSKRFAQELQLIGGAYRDAYGGAMPPPRTLARIKSQALELLTLGWPAAHVARLAAELPTKGYASLAKHAEHNPPAPVRAVRGADGVRDRCPRHPSTLATACGLCAAETAATATADQPPSSTGDGQQLVEQIRARRTTTRARP